jgi:hypothetical protein
MNVHQLDVLRDMVERLLREYGEGVACDLRAANNDAADEAEHARRVANGLCVVCGSKHE